jgi:hypothetical protein
MSEALGQKLAPAEIFALFKAIANDAGEETDDDIATAETFERAVNRYNNLWQIIPIKRDSK